MSPYGAGELWTGPDQMPSCHACLNGRHGLCADFMASDKYGTHACGCGNEMHDEEGQ